MTIRLPVDSGAWRSPIFRHRVCQSRQPEPARGHAAEGGAPGRNSAAPSFLAVDFFCGAGGTTRGLIDANGYVIAGIDKDAGCERTYVGNNINTTLDRFRPRFLNRDILCASADSPDGERDALPGELADLIRRRKMLAPRAPLLFAICAPCQPFTRLSQPAGLTGKRKAERNKDRSLLMEAAKFVRQFRPELVFSENVSGIGAKRHGGIWDGFQDDLTHLGYLVGADFVCASRFGVAQRRRRAVLIAVRRDVAGEAVLGSPGLKELPVPESDPAARAVGVREAIGHLPPIRAGDAHPGIPNHRTRTLSALNLRRLMAAKPGESNACLERTPHGDLSLRCHRDVNRRLRTRCFNDVYTRMHPERPAPTITTKCHSISNGRFGHYDTGQVRGISLREAAILQSFPESYVFHPEEQITSVARMIGNSVPPKLAAFFAAHLAGLCAATTPRGGRPR